MNIWNNEWEVIKRNCSHNSDRQNYTCRLFHFYVQLGQLPDAIYSGRFFYNEFLLMYYHQQVYYMYMYCTYKSDKDTLFKLIRFKHNNILMYT